MSAMMATMFEGTVFTFTETIGEEDHYLRQVEASFAWDMSAMAVAGGEFDEDFAGGTVSFSVVATFDDFNSAPEVTAPEDAEIMDTEDILDFMQFAMGGFGPGGRGGRGDDEPEETPEP
jgi:hypothetical protein